MCNMRRNRIARNIHRYRRIRVSRWVMADQYGARRAAARVADARVRLCIALAAIWTQLLAVERRARIRIVAIAQGRRHCAIDARDFARPAVGVVKDATHRRVRENVACCKLRLQQIAVHIGNENNTVWRVLRHVTDVHGAVGRRATRIALTGVRRRIARATVGAQFETVNWNAC